MIESTIIFQRTQAGRDEIHQKSHGLTQSERLVLIMVDGVSTCGAVRAKLPVLSDERFDRALEKLQKKDLVLEVFMPVDGQPPEELEPTVIDRFLQQDPLDPVTIILRDPDEELGMLGELQSKKDVMTPQVPTLSEPTPAVSAPPAPVGIAPVLEVAPTTEPAVDAHHAQLADSLAEELRARRIMRPPVQYQPHVITHQPPQPDTPDADEISPFMAVHWGYWLIVAGSFYILGFVSARLTS